MQTVTGLALFFHSELLRGHLKVIIQFAMLEAKIQLLSHGQTKMLRS